MFTRRNVLRAVAIALVITAALLGVDQVGDGEYPRAIVWFAIATLWAIWAFLVPAFSFGEPGKQPHPLQSVIPLATTLLIIALTLLN